MMGTFIHRITYNNVLLTLYSENQWTHVLFESFVTEQTLLLKDIISNEQSIIPFCSARMIWPL